VGENRAAGAKQKDFISSGQRAFETPAPKAAKVFACSFTRGQHGDEGAGQPATRFGLEAAAELMNPIRLTQCIINV
jgi:hypothetical protein